MAVAERIRTRIGANPGLVTVVVTIIGYALVMNAFEQYVSIFPSISEPTVRLLSNVIVVINATTLVTLLVGVYFIKQRQIQRHRIAMVTAVVLEVGFLVIYLLKVGGGGELEILATGTARLVYLGVLAVHLVCSALSVPAVVYALTLGLSRSPSELMDTNHAKAGKIAVAVWSISLALGIVTHAMLRYFGSELRTVGMIFLG